MPPPPAIASGSSVKGEAGSEPVEAGGAEWTRGGKRPGVEGHGRCVGLALLFLATPSLVRLVRHPHSPRNLHTSPGPMWLQDGHLPKDRLTAGARWVLVLSPLRWADGGRSLRGHGGCGCGGLLQMGHGEGQKRPRAMWLPEETSPVADVPGGLSGS